MSKVTSLIRRAPKRFSAAVLMVAAAIIIPAAVFAWGPSRPTYTIENPADHITFNSITNNPHYGDERNFVTIKDAANQNAGGWVDDVTVQNGKEYYVRMYVHNNASANLNLVAQNVMAQFNVPDYSAKKIQIDGYLSASNATPAKVWDQAIFHGDSNFKLQYVAGSASYTNNKFPSGTTLPDTLVSSGAKLGYEEMNGKIPGCFQYDGLVIFKVKAVTSDFKLEKTVRLSDAEDKTFKESVNAKAGDKVDYQIYFKNTGGTQLNDVVVKDTLPAGVSYVPDSTYLHTANGGTRKVADGITTNGLNIGNYAAGASAYLKFTAKINPSNDPKECGPNKLRNVAKATTSVGSQTDSADVNVNKECAPGEIKVCELKTGNIITIDEDDFDSSKHSKNLSKCEDKPTTPPELPKTGAAESIVAIIGLGALIASIAYYVASRRALS